MLLIGILAALTALQQPDLPMLQLQLINRISASSSQQQLEAELRGMLQKLEKPAQTQTVAVIGGGLSGLTATLRLMEQGQSVVLIDKSPFFGGNSAKASSGINGALTELQVQNSIDDSPDTFYNDTMHSSQREAGSYTASLARRMADDSKKAVEWIAKSAGVNLEDVGQMGGHSIARTHRPRGKLSGAAFISGLERAIMGHKNFGKTKLHKGVALEGLTRAGDSSFELKLRKVKDDGRFMMRVGSVILATGGFGADGGAGGLLQELAPELTSIATTNGGFATGDGIKIGREMGAKTVDMDMIQVHPTGFSDMPKGFKPKQGARQPLILCAEILRGVGGVLLDATGERFVDELDTRKAVTAKMNEKMPGQKNFAIVLPPAAAAKVSDHVHIYSGKGLLRKVDGATGVADFLMSRYHDCGGGGETTEGGSQHSCDAAAREGVAKRVAQTFEETAAGSGSHPRRAPTVLPLEGEYHVGVVEPVVHYTMGGLAIDRAGDGQVVDENDKPIAGLYAAGEVIGGVHGVNRLGGSSLLDCVVFGLASADAVTKRHREFTGATDTAAAAAPAYHHMKLSDELEFSWAVDESAAVPKVDCVMSFTSEKRDDCWVGVGFSDQPNSTMHMADMLVGELNHSTAEWVVNQYRSSPKKGGNTRPLLVPPGPEQAATLLSHSSEVSTTAEGAFKAVFRFSRALDPSSRLPSRRLEQSSGASFVDPSVLPKLERGKKVGLIWGTCGKAGQQSIDLPGGKPGYHFGQRSEDPLLMVDLFADAESDSASGAGSAAAAAAASEVEAPAAAADGGTSGRLEKVPEAERVRVKLGDLHYEISQFVGLHPGGEIAIEDGGDLTDRFLAAHGKDWSLLEREEIIPVNGLGKKGTREVAPPPKEEHHLANYGGKGGSWREILGRHAWFVLHSMAAKYPEYPTDADRQAMLNLVGTFGQLYPCKLCRTHLQQQLRDPELGAPGLGSRTNMTMWMCRLHNIVNKDIGKPLHECTPLGLDLMYLKNCGECEVVKKGEEITASAKSGFHPTSGPWDGTLYTKDPLLLASATTATELVAAKSVANIIDTIAGLKLKPKLREEATGLLKGPGGKKWKKKLQSVLTKARKMVEAALKEGL